MTQEKKYTGLDIAKFIFALTIPVFHISGRPTVLGYMSEYISRFAVPFFFAISGFFLSISINKKGRKKAFIEFERHNLILYVFWIVIDLHILLQYYPNKMILLHECLCESPAYLWFIPAMMLGGIICFVNQKYKRPAILFSVLLYLFGTYFSDSYEWISGGMPDWYISVFLTTKNGLFFGLPMMMVGMIAREVSCQRVTYRRVILIFVVSLALFWIEVHFIDLNAQSSADRSMYFLLPVVTFGFVYIFKNVNPSVDTLGFRKASAAIYLMQYVAIYYGNKIAKAIINIDHLAYWFVYAFVIVVPTLLAIIVRNTKIGRIVL